MPRRVGLAAAAELTTESFGPRGSGRIRHEEKITVYVSAEELLALEQARLTLRARHGVAVDRGRIVREAIALMLADLEASGDDSELVRRLSAS
jgi:phage tail protein X